MAEPTQSNQGRNAFLYLAIVLVACVIFMGTRGTNRVPESEPAAETGTIAETEEQTGSTPLWCGILPLAAFGLWVAYTVYTNIRQRREWRDYRAAVRGQAATIRDKYTLPQTQRPLTPSETATLAAALVHTGDFAAAADLTGELIISLIGQHLPQANQGALSSTVFKIALLTHCDALKFQGKFIEAAQALQQYHFGFIDGRMLLTSMNYFWGGDADHARVALGTLRATPNMPPPPRITTTGINTAEVAHRYAYPDRAWLAYLRYKLFDDADARGVLREYAEHITRMAETTAIFPDSPFTQRYQECLAEMHTLAAESPPPP